MDDLVEVAITDATSNYVKGKYVSKKAGSSSGVSINLVYLKGEFIWFETAPLVTETTFIFYPVGEKPTYGYNWICNLPKREPVEIGVICCPRVTVPEEIEDPSLTCVFPKPVPKLSPIEISNRRRELTFGQPQLLSDPNFYGLPRYSVQAVQQKGLRFMGNWSIASDKLWLSNLSLDHCTYPRTTHCYGTCEVDSGSDLKKIHFAVGKKTGTDLYHILLRAPVEVERVYRRICEWNIKLTGQMEKWLNISWDDTLIIICYDSDRSPQIFNERHKVGNGVYRLTDTVLKKPNINYLTLTAESQPTDWGRTMSTESLEIYLEAMRISPDEPVKWTPSEQNISVDMLGAERQMDDDDDMTTAMAMTMDMEE